MAHIEANTSVFSVPEVARLQPERREMLEKLLGDEGLESAMLALRPGHILWSDDYPAGESVKLEFGVELVWTQAVVEQFATLGLIDHTLATEVYAKMIGCDFQSTHFTGSVMLAAFRLAGNSIQSFPMPKMISVFGDVTKFDRRASFLLLGEFLMKLTLEPALPESRCEAMKSFLNTYPNDDITNTQLDAFAKQCALAMTLAPQATGDFLTCYNGWRRQRRSRILIVGA